MKKTLPNRKVAERLGALILNTRKTRDIPLKQRSDEELMDAYQDGNASAFDTLLSRHHKPVYNFIFRFLHNAEAAEEAFQEVFLRVVKNRQDYRKSAKFTTWLYTIARNYCIDELRKRKFRNHASLYKDEDVGGDRFLDDDHKSTREAFEISSAKEIETYLEEALVSLGPEQQEVFLLRHFQNMPFDDIAKISNVSVNTIKSRMRYALQHIQKFFEVKGII